MTRPGDDTTPGPGRRPVVDVLLDPTDDAAITIGLLRRHDPPGGRVVVHPTPAATHIRELGHDLLAALGRPIDRLADERLAAARPAWRAVAAWLLADRVTDLIVLRADRLTPACWGELLDLCCPDGARLTLVCHTQPIPPRLAGTLDRVDHQVLTAPDLTGLPRPGRRHGDRRADDPHAAPLPPVTYPGTISYRRRAFDRLGPTRFAASDAVYQKAQTFVRARLDAHPAHLEDEHGRHTVMALLTELVHDSPDRTHTLARLRGAQAAFRRHGLKLTLPTSRGLLYVHAGPGLTSVPVTNRVAEQIRAGVAHPVRAAALATALLTGLEPSTLRPLRWAALAPANDTLRINYRTTTAIERPPPDTLQRILHLSTPATFHIPPAARPLLQAARAFAKPDPSNTRRRLFASGTPVNESITADAANCGIALNHQPQQPPIPWQARIRIEHVDYFGGPYDVGFAADQLFDPEATDTHKQATDHDGPSRPAIR